MSSMVRKAILLLAVGICAMGTTAGLGVAFATSSNEVVAGLTAEKIEIPVPGKVLMWPEVTEKVASEKKDDENVLTVKYKTEVWGNVVADFSDFRAKVAETLADARGWVRAGIKFVEVSSGEDVDVILSDPAHLEALNGCSGELSCTTWNNQVIINDVRWREGTEATRTVGMGQRDYQHMVVNHEMGHWLGHYSHVESCPNGGVAPLMLQQSTGMRGCDTFNAWPLEWELWTNKK
ncbi:DUF3152 domain-containing protein [Candidatus Saccharibacteria bacterium]|nr:DUF3152 domain-containing protein [Candidatus Saccharibacteria bacterium]